ncbi:hypothetical protein BKI52_05645 [marine bacterium AO1-C]|nr:hypothetical protein BKI52_05645 [marine bacterium AO1-C]
MKKRFKQYFEWLFAGNVLTFNAEASQGKLVFEGRSKAFRTLIINSFGSLAVMTAPMIFIAFDIRPPLLVFLFVILMLAGFIAFGIGMIAMAYQPFWQHRNKINITPQGIFTTNGIFFPLNTHVKRIKRFKIRFQVVDSGVIHLQCWLNGRKTYFVNAFILKAPQTEAEIFEWFQVYAAHWGLNYYDVSPSKDQSIGIFEFAKQGKNVLERALDFAQLKQQALDNQLKVGSQPEMIVKYAFQKNNDDLIVSRRPGFKKRAWIFLICSFLGGLGLLGLLIFVALPNTPDNKPGVYVFTACIAFLWFILTAVAFHDVRSDFLIKANTQQLYFQKRKNQGIAFSRDNIERLVIRGKINAGRNTTLQGNILVILKEKTTFREKEIQEQLLLAIFSGRPEKIDTQLVRDAVYERSMRVARLIAQPLGIEVIWEGFEQ